MGVGWEVVLRGGDEGEEVSMRVGVLSVAGGVALGSSVGVLSFERWRVSGVGVRPRSLWLPVHTYLRLYRRCARLVRFGSEPVPLPC